MGKIWLYIETLRYLKLSQVYWRIIRRFAKKRHPKTKIEPLQKCDFSKWIPSIQKPNSLLSTAPWRFRFLNHESELENGWNSPDEDKLWLYNLHYHEALLSDAPESTKNELIQKWIQQNPFGHGNGWEPYPLSLRIVNWIKYSFSAKSLPDKFWESLFQQSYSLEGQVEYHLLGNHLFENAKALIFAGCIFEGDKGKKWRNLGFRILKAQIDEQIMEDGGHFERSPMYHCIILEGILDLINLSYSYNFSEEIKGHLNKIVPNMLSWIEAMTHPDENISFFNDSAFRIAATPGALFDYGSRLGLKKPAPKTGFNFLKGSQFLSFKNEQLTLLADMGTVGPSYIPGHAHAETFSFELSINNKRLFVNSGISTYNNNLIRDSQRSTGAHNTLSIDGKNSSNVWGAFRVGERAHVSNFFAKEDGNAIHFGAQHDGYHKRLNAIHSREFIVGHEEVTIKDYVHSKTSHNIEAAFHIHPDFHVTQIDESTYEISNFNLKFYLKFNGAPSTFRSFLWSPEFNTYVHATKIIAQTNSKAPLVATVSWGAQ